MIRRTINKPGNLTRHYLFLIYAVCLLLVWCLLPLSATGQETADTILDSVAVRGIDDTLAGEMASSLLSRKEGILNDGLIDHDLDTIVTYLRERGWWNATASAAADTISAGRAVLTFDVSPGKPVVFGGIDIDTAGDAGTADGTPEFNAVDVKGERFTRGALEGIVDDLIDRYTGEGYPGVTVTPLFSARNDTVDVKLSLATGRRAGIDSIAVRGLTRTKEAVIRRELAGLVGRPASHETAEEARALIDRLSFVRASHPPGIEYDAGGRGMLAVELQEGGQGTFDGVLGYQPDDSGGSGEVIGKIDLGFTNLFGTGRSARFRWENLGNQTEDLEIGYTEPWVLGYPYDVSLSFVQEERESLGYVKTSASAGIGRHIGSLRLNAGLRYEKVSADTLHSSRAAGVQADADWTILDNRLNPSRGIRYGAAWSMVSKRYRLGSGGRTSLERLEIDFDHYIPTLAHQTAALLLRYRRVDIDLEHLSASDRYWLGGATTIRGHGERIFPAVKAFWATAEYRFLTGETSRVFLFCDTGYLVNRERTAGRYVKKTREATGYGFGIRISSRAGVLGFDYGLGRGDGPGDGKLHVSLRTEF